MAYSKPSRILRPNDYDALYLAKEHPPVIVNNMAVGNDAQVNALRAFLAREYEDGKSVDPTAKCACGKTYDNLNLGNLCTSCNTLVSSLPHTETGTSAWFEAPAGIDRFPTNGLIGMLSHNISTRTDGVVVDIIQYASDVTYRRVQGSMNKSFDNSVAKLEAAGWVRGMNYFLSHLSEFVRIVKPDHLFAAEITSGINAQYKDIFEELLLVPDNGLNEYVDFLIMTQEEWDSKARVLVDAVTKGVHVDEYDDNGNIIKPKKPKSAGSVERKAFEKVVNHLMLKSKPFRSLREEERIELHNIDKEVQKVNLAASSYRDLITYIDKYKDILSSKYSPLLHKNRIIVKRKGSRTFSDADSFVAIGWATELSAHKASGDTSNEGLDKIVSGWWNFYMHNAKFFKTTLSAKRGDLRHILAASCTSWSFRVVIGSSRFFAKYDEISVPWVVGIEVFRLHLVNMLIHIHMYTEFNAFRKVDNAVHLYDPLLDELMKEICIPEGSNRRGYPVSWNRNPSQELLSINRTYMTIKTNIHDLSGSMCTLTCSGFNSDYDGDGLGGNLALSVDVAEASDHLHFKYGIQSISNIGALNGQIGHTTGGLETLGSFMNKDLREREIVADVENNGVSLGANNTFSSFGEDVYDIS